MVNFRKVNENDILKDWLLFRDDEISSLTCEDDRKHWIYFDEISDKILNSIPKHNRDFVRRQLNVLDNNFWIILAIGMRSIIGMDLWMEFRWLWGVLRNMYSYNIKKKFYFLFILVIIGKYLKFHIFSIFFHFFA